MHILLNTDYISAHPTVGPISERCVCGGGGGLAQHCQYWLQRRLASNFTASV